MSKFFHWLFVLVKQASEAVQKFSTLRDISLNDGF